MKHYLPLFLLALALIGCEKNGIDYDIVAGHTYVCAAKYYSTDTFHFYMDGTCKHNSYSVNFNYTQDENLVCVMESMDVIFLSYHNQIVLLPSPNAFSSSVIYKKIE